MIGQFFQAPLCVICHEEISAQIGWVQLFSAESETPLCQNCRKKLVKISGETCRICCRPFAHLDHAYRKGDLCFDCLRWEEDPLWRGTLNQNVSLFLYNDFLKEALALFKFRGDYMIAHAFSDFIKIKLKKMKFDLLVPIPLSPERLYERGFNQSEALIKEAGFEAAQLLKRIHSEKQSKKSRSERIHLPQVFRLHPEAPEIVGQTVVLVDDVYTTGSTLRHAAKIIKQAGAASVIALTLARG
jgi:competence protein ComFC